MKRQLKLAAVFLILASANASADELTADQCAEYKQYGTVALSEDQKTELESMCKAKYSSENGFSNCMFYEAENIKEKLKSLAGSACR